MKRAGNGSTGPAGSGQSLIALVLLMAMLLGTGLFFISTKKSESASLRMKVTNGRSLTAFLSRLETQLAYPADCKTAFFTSGNMVMTLPPISQANQKFVIGQIKIGASNPAYTAGSIVGDFRITELALIHIADLADSGTLKRSMYKLQLSTQSVKTSQTQIQAQQPEIIVLRDPAGSPAYRIADCSTGPDFIETYSALPASNMSTCVPGPSVDCAGPYVFIGHVSGCVPKHYDPGLVGPNDRSLCSTFWANGYGYTMAPGNSNICNTICYQ